MSTLKKLLIDPINPYIRPDQEPSPSAVRKWTEEDMDKYMDQCFQYWASRRGGIVVVRDGQASVGYTPTPILTCTFCGEKDLDKKFDNYFTSKDNKVACPPCFQRRENLQLAKEVTCD